MPVSSTLTEESALEGLICKHVRTAFILISSNSAQRWTHSWGSLNVEWMSQRTSERMYKNRIWPNPKSRQIIHARSVWGAALACDSTIKRNATSWWKCIVCFGAFQKATTSLAPIQIYDCTEVIFRRFQHFIDKTIVVINAQIRHLQKHSSPWIPRHEYKIWMLLKQVIPHESEPELLFLL